MTIIYGAGKYGKAVKEFLNAYDIIVNYFCETEVAGDRFIDGVQVVSLYELPNLLDEKSLVLIAIKNKSTSKQIRLRLTSILLDKVCVIEAGEFIKNNIMYMGGRYCLLCGSNIDKFMPGGLESEVFARYHIIGGGHRENCICPTCGSSDRNRWFMFVLSNYTNIFEGRFRVLHFAPESNVSERIMSNPNCDYYSVDIQAGRAMHVVDILDIPYRDSFFDYVILNHVMEHISNESVAMKEIQRVLKIGGKMIISFPICTNIDTFEDNNISSSEDRLKYYGQDDHVRLYGRDYKARMEKYGWQVDVYTPQEKCSRKELDKYGFIYDDVIMICEVS